MSGFNIRNVPRFKAEMQLSEESHLSMAIETSNVLASIKILTGPVTSATTRLASMVEAMKVSQEIKYLLKVAILTLGKEDIESGIMDKDSSNNMSMIQQLDNRKMPVEALNIFRKRFSDKSAAALYAVLKQSLRLFPAKGKTISSSFFNSNVEVNSKILSKLWKYDWASIVNQKLASYRQSANLVNAKKDLLGKVSKADTGLVGAVTMSDFKERLEILKGTLKSPDDEDTDAALESESEEDIEISKSCILKAIDKIASETKIDNVVSNSVVELGNKIKNTTIITDILLANNGVYIGLTNRFKCKSSDLQLFIPDIPIGDAIMIEDKSYTVIDGIAYILGKVKLSSSVDQAKKSLRDSLGVLARPNASKYVKHFAVVFNDSERVSMFESGTSNLVLEKAYNDGWDVVSLSSPNKASAIWSPKAGMEQFISAYHKAELKRVSKRVHVADVCEYELSANQLYVNTEIKRCTTSLWLLTPNVTDNRVKTRFDIDLGGRVILGQRDGIEPITMFVDSNVADGFISQLSSTNKYASLVEDAYLISRRYKKLLHNGEKSLDNAVVKLSQARNKGLVTSEFSTVITVKGLKNTTVELIGRSDGHRKNKMSTQLLSAARLSAKLLGMDKVVMPFGNELKVAKELIKRCIDKTGFNPMDATVSFVGSDGKPHVIEHVVVGAYQVLVDVSQNYDSRVVKSNYSGRYFSAKLVAEIQIPHIAALANKVSANTRESAHELRALINLKKYSAVKNNVRVISLSEFADELKNSKNKLLKYTGIYNSNHQFEGFVSQTSEQLMNDVSEIAVSFGASLTSSVLNKENAEKLIWKYGDVVNIPVFIKDRITTVLRVKLPEPTPVLSYTDAITQTQKYAATQTMRFVINIIRSMRTSDTTSRKSSVAKNVASMMNKLKHIAYDGEKAAAPLPGIKGRVSTNVCSKEGFALNRKDFVKLASNPVALKMAGLNENAISDVVNFIDSLNGNMSMKNAMKVKKIIESYRPDGKIWLIAIRSPVLNYMGVGYVEGLIDQKVVSIPHFVGSKMAADDDGDIVSILFANKRFDSIFDVLGEGTDNSRRGNGKEVASNKKVSANSKKSVSAKTMKKITREFVSEHKETLFVFGDNAARKGFGGQAREMRGMPNALGIPTKRLPEMGANAFFSDKKEEIEIVKDSLVELVKLTDKYRSVVIPSAGLGTGRAKLREKSPKIDRIIRSVFDKLGVSW